MNYFRYKQFNKDVITVKDNFYIISIEIVFFSLIQELYVPDSFMY
ncbi:hypothetical protein ACHEUX_00975 [Staphylococcus capitis]